MKKIVLAIPSVCASIVAGSPVLTCPTCWPLYAGLLSAMGVNFVNYTPYILPVTAIMLLVSLVVLGWKAKERRGYLPLVVGVLASVLLLVGKFAVESNLLFYIGVILLISASLWNVWPKRHCGVCNK